MGEPVPVWPVLGQQPGLQRRLHCLQHLLVVAAGDLGQQRVEHDPARYRGDRQQFLGRAWQGGDPLADDLGHRPRHRERRPALAAAAYLLGVAD